MLSAFCHVSNVETFLTYSGRLKMTRFLLVLLKEVKNMRKKLVTQEISQPNCGIVL
jgi:hypothetical protein